MDTKLSLLEALLKDVTGNLLMGNSKNAAGYLKSISLLTGAMSRQCQQQFELGVIEELEAMAPSGETAGGLETKRKLSQRELELSKLEVELADFFANVSSACYATAEHAADSLRSIAEDVEKQEGSELFPKPMSKDDVKAWAAERGIRYVDETEPGEGGSFRERLNAMIGTPSKGPRKSKASSKNSKRRTVQA